MLPVAVLVAFVQAQTPSFPLGPADASPAFSRFQVVGASASHVALRELFDVRPRPERVDCGYRITPRELGAHGVRLHLVPYAVGELAPVSGDGTEVFQIYDSVTNRRRCTGHLEAKARLLWAKTAARARDVEMDARATPFLLGRAQVPVELCPAPEDESDDPRCGGSAVIPELSDVRWKVETEALDEESTPPGPVPPLRRVLVTLELDRGGGREKVAATTEGRLLRFQPLQLYRVAGRVVLLAAFREGAGAERPFLLVLDGQAPISVGGSGLADDDAPLAPLVRTQ